MPRVDLAMAAWKLGAKALLARGEEWLGIDAIADATERSRARVAAALSALAVPFAVGACPLAVYVAESPPDRARLYGGLALIVIVSAVYALRSIRARQVQRASIAMIAAQSLLCCLPAALYGPATPLFYFAPVVIVMAGWLLGRGGVVWLMLLLIGVCAGLSLVPPDAFLPPIESPVAPVGHIAAVLFLALWAGAVQELHSGSLREALARSHAELCERRRAEAGLVAAEERLRAVLDQSPQAMCVLDAADNVLVLNRAARAIVGLSGEDVDGRPVLAWQAFDEIPGLRERARSALLRARQGGAELLEVAFTGAEGRPTHLDLHVRPVFAASGAVDLVLLTGIDTTALREAARSLVALHEVGLQLPLCRSRDEVCRRAVELGRERLGFDRLSIWFRSPEEGVLVGTYGTAEDGSLRDEHGARCEYTAGSPTARVLLHGVSHVVTDEETLLDDRGRPVGRGSSGVAALWDGNEVIGCLYHDNLLSGRAYGDLQHEMAALYASALGHLLGRLRAEEGRRAEALAYTEIMNATPEAILVHDPTDARITDVNESALRMFAMTRERMLGLTPDALSAEGGPEDAGRALALVQTALRGPQLFEWQSRDDTGRVFWTEVSLRSATIRGAVRVVAVVRDIAERKREEEEQRRLREGMGRTQRLESIGLLAGGIAHDFNNILTPILGYAELLLARTDGDEDARAKLGQIMASATRARELIGQILTFSRQGEVRREIAQPQELVEEALHLIRAFSPASIVIHQRLAEDCGAVLADPTQFHQVVVNLFTNAAHAIGGASGFVTVSLDEVEVDQALAARAAAPTVGRYACLAISDTGCGMEPALLERIFEPFFTTKPTGEETGLGLSVVHGIVKGHGGGMAVESEVGRGTTFRVYWPLAVLDDSTRAIEAGPPTSASGRVLLVDDEAPVVSVASEALRSLGYVVEAYTDSREALRAFRAAPDAFDLVLTDHSMPNISGSELFAAVRAIRPLTPVVVATGYSPGAEAALWPSAAKPRILSKPYTVRELGEAVRDALSGSDPSAAAS